MRDAIAVVAVDPSAVGFNRIAEELECVFVSPAASAVAAGIEEARARRPGGRHTDAPQRGGAPDQLRWADHRGRTITAVIVPANRPELVFRAAIEGAQRIAVWHGSERGAAPGDLREAMMRAAFALVDLTIVADEAAESCAVRSGADPDRIIREDEAVVDRLLLEPPRKPRSKALVEVAASLALDAARASGLIRALELASVDRGVNVVNYHRVLPLREITAYCRPQMAIAEPIFEAQLDVIARMRGFTRVDRVHEERSAGRVAITFDDGYEDNFRVALPILQRFSTPACIFIVTNLIGRPDALWWDRIGLALFVYWRDECVVEAPHTLPERVRLLKETRSFEEARKIISAVISDLNQKTHEERLIAVKAAESLVPKLAPCRTMLSWEEVEQMARIGIVFGAHTRNHVPLDEVSAEVAREELFGAQSDLSMRIGIEQPAVVALPRGRLGEISEEEMRGHGVDGVMTSDAGVNRVGDDSLFVLRRDGRMLTLHGRHHPAKLRLELTGLVDRLRAAISSRRGESGEAYDSHAGQD